jgi:hypothetical protein
MKITSIQKLIPPSDNEPNFTLVITRSDGATLNLSLTPEAYSKLFVLVDDYEKSQEGG